MAAHSQVLMSKAASFTCDHFHSLPSTPWLFARNLLVSATGSVVNPSSYLSMATSRSSPLRNRAVTGESGRNSQTRAE